MVLGDLADYRLSASATWLDIVPGTPIVGDDRGDRLVGMHAAMTGLRAAPQAVSTPRLYFIAISPFLRLCGRNRSVLRDLPADRSPAV